MTKKERQSRITWQIDYGMNKILKAESDYWAERDFEYFIFHVPGLKPPALAGQLSAIS